MFSYAITAISPHVTQLQDITGVSAFLVTGQSKALLIDACTGLGDLQGAVRALTSLPVEMVLTHGHGDHTGAASRFETVYLRHEDLPVVREHDLNSRLGYVRMFVPRDPAVTAGELAPDMTRKPLDFRPGEIFDLGGVHVEMVAVPGHTEGMVCPLIREDRVILYGDACNANTLILEGGLEGVRRYRESLLALKTRSGDYDVTLCSHGPAVVPDCLDGNIELCNRILSGTDDGIEAEFLGMTMYRAAAVDETFNRLDGGLGNISYTK